MSSDEHAPRARGARRTQQHHGHMMHEFDVLTAAHGALSLGKGFPDFSPPDYMKQALSDTVLSDDAMLHQYAPYIGHARLVRAIATMYSPLHGRRLNADNITVTCGAFCALSACITAYVDPGDEVLIVEPYFGPYADMTRMAGGTPIFVPMRPQKQQQQQGYGTATTSGDWKIDADELERCCGPKTKMLILNSPNNPVGKVFDVDELRMLADVACRRDLVVVSDEVYEWLTFDARSHVRVATLPDMWQRTLTISSGGKMFSATGWKTGWVIACDTLTGPVRSVLGTSFGSFHTPTQEAIAIGLERELARLNSSDSYLGRFTSSMQRKRDLLVKHLEEAGIPPVVPEGGYFIIADFSNVVDHSWAAEVVNREARDVRFAKWLIREHKLSTIPVSAFYSPANRHIGENYVRLCFIKKDETLQKVGDILRQWSLAKLQ